MEYQGIPWTHSHFATVSQCFHTVQLLFNSDSTSLQIDDSTCQAPDAAVLTFESKGGVARSAGRVTF